MHIKESPQKLKYNNNNNNRKTVLTSVVTFLLSSKSVLFPARAITMLGFPVTTPK